MDLQDFALFINLRPHALHQSGQAAHQFAWVDQRAMLGEQAAMDIFDFQQRAGLGSIQGSPLFRQAELF